MRTYSHNVDLARTVVGIVGNVLSFALFISPAPVFWRVLKSKSVEGFHYFPYVASIMNCVLWVYYGLPVIHPHSTLIITINGVGLALEVIYTTIYFWYTDKQRRLRILAILAGEVVIVAILVAFSLSRIHSNDSRSNFIGAFCTVFGIIMYGSPLSIIGKVIKTKSVEYMPFSLSLAGFLNGVCWTTYALLEFDLYVLIGNGVGAALGLSQLVLYGCYYSSTPKKREEEADKASQVQLSTV